MDYGLKFVGKAEEIECFVDASLGTSDSEGKFTTGLVLKIFGDLVFWKTKRQTHVALFSAEAQYIAMAQAARKRNE